MRVRRALESDLGQMVALSEAVGTASHWTQQQWLDIFQSEAPARIAWLAEEEAGESCGRGIGFLVALNGGPEWELENLAVREDFRRQGVGLRLLEALRDEARSLGAGRILLEVRASNEAAICFYKASGFELVARRNDYYQSPREDALIMTWLILG